MKITDEQKEKAAFVNLPQFLMAHGFDLKKVGREYVWKDHDSLHIKDNGPGERGTWFRFSEDKGGDNIGLFREYMDMSFLDAVEALTGEHIDRTYTPSRTYESKPVQQTARELSLAEADNCRRVFAYLCKTRGLDYDMLSALVKKGIISQEEKTGNVLFKYYDDQGKAIGAEKVGTSTEHKFKGIATGSAGGHGFEVVHGTGEKAFFFESAIDMLSYLQMHSKELDNCRLVSMMGVKPSIVLDTMLRHNIAPENVFLCSDNDTAGNEFARRLQEQYPDMKRIITPDTYKDWNDMLRNIPKQIEVEQETKTKEVDSVADLMTYGNKMWNNATDNRDKSLISMQLADFQRVQEMLEKSGINYYAYEMNSTVRMAVNDKDTDWLRKIFGNMNVTKSNRPYFPPEKNIIGNTEYRYIPQKEYVTADRDLVLKMADIMARRGMQFSGRIYPSGKGTLTVSHADFVAVRNIKDEVISMRKQFASPDKAQEVGNRDYCANRDTRYYMSKLTPEQFKEVKPFLETSVSYHAVSREGKVAFAVDKENAPAFHRALENAVREVGMLRNMADLGLTMEQNVALSPVVHRLAVEDVKLNLADFFDNRYDEAQFGEMLSLVDAYLSQAPAERYGEHSKLNDMLEAKSSFDRSIELSDFFSQHDFSDEQRAAITAMFVGDVTKGQIDSIDETFTAEDIQAYDEILHNALQESDVADFLTAHKQAVTDRENASKVPTEEEVLFQQADLAKFLAERTLSSDEWEDMAYPLFSSGYLDKHNPSDKATFGYNLSESALYDLAQRFLDGEDIRRELALGLLRGGTTADIEFIFEQGEISDRTYYYAENLRHSLHTEKTEGGYHCSFSGMERFVSFEEIGQAFIDRIHEEFDDLAYLAVLDYIKDDIPDISDDTVKELITAFDGAALHGWENGDNQPKLNRIKKALFDVLGDEEQTEKAFACIAKHKYNVTFEPEQPEKQPDSLTFHFGKGDGDEWVSESDIVHDFALAHPDCSFALGNAVLEYLDEKQHSERNIPDLKAGWYKKTDFTITAVIGGEEFSYEGRFDIGDGKGTGGGSLIDHIRAHNEGILGYTQHPFNQPEYQERAKHTLDVFVPFLEAHSELTAEEQRIFDDFKEQHPIRGYDDITVAEEKLQTLQQIVDKFFGTDCESAETENGTWKLAIAEGDKVGELFYGGDPVCGIYNRGDKMEIEPYRELSTFPKLLQTAMLEHNPDKPVEIMDFQRIFETPLDKAKWLINDFCEAEYHNGADFSDLHNIGLAFTTLTDDELPIQVTADLVDFKITHEFDGEVFDTEQFDSIEDMIENGLTELDFSDLVSVPDEVIDRHTSKAEQAVELMSDASAVETPAQDTADIDKPLFTDETVINEIQRNEQDDVPFWEKNDIEGEQLSLFGDAEPLTASKSVSQKPKLEFAKGPVVDSVQVYEALAAEIDRGTGFVHGKLRVQDFYEEQHPTVQQLADFLKKEYGTGGHSGEGKISLVDYNSQGITFNFENGEKFRHSWYNVATMTEARLRNDTYLSAEQKAERAALKAEQPSEEHTSHNTVEVGDRFRHKITGKVSEVVSLTGALPFYTDDCTVSRESGGFAITENISYDKLLNSGMYEYIGRNDPEKEQPAHMKPEPVADVTPETEKPDIPDVKNLSQLKRAIKPGMMFEISDHLRPECVGERRIVTGVSTVDFTSRKLDKNGEPTGKDIHMEFDRAKNWTFDGGELTSRLDNGDMLMSFHFIDGLERTKESERETITAEVVSSDEPVAEESTTPAPTPDKGDNFTITGDNLGDGGAKMKFRANVDAIRTLKTLEAEKRPATAEEKEILSKYVGWGALAKAFDKNDEKWATEYKELSELLTPQEYAQARSTVNDAFYTSPTVIDGVFEALGNFGFDGGIMAFVTSTGTLDKRDETTRQMLADKADFIGAIRLPGGKNGAFKDNAGTEVTTDIIFLKKHEGKSLAEMSDIPDWVHIGETADGLPINKYFEQHLDMVLGTVVEGNKLYGSGTMVVAEDSFDLKSALHEAVGKLSAEISHEHGRDVYAKTADGVQVQIPSNLRNYSFFMSDDQVFFKKNNAACEFRFDRGTAQHKRFKAFIELRDLTRELIEAMELDKPDSVIKDLQTKLNVAYDDFYKKYGIIHSQTNKRYFSEDVSYNLVAGLEKSYDKTKLLAKSDIFTKRTIVPPKAVDHVDTALEALTLSVAEKARVDFSYMSGLTSMTEDELKRDLTGAIFKIPHTENGYQTASEYLSCDIRKKLREAEEIAEYDPDFNINVSALKQAMPEPLKAGDIDIKLGAAWLDPKYYEQFMYELLQTPAYQRSDSPSARWNKSAIVGVEYSVHANSFHVSNKSSDRSVLATQKYGTHKMNAYDIFEHLLNLQEPKVYKTIEVPDGLGDTKEKRVVDIDATRVVQRKADDIRKAFKAWIFKDPQRREAIVEKYNELFNSIRPREFDGSALSFPMMTSDIKLHDHQKNAIAHAMFGGNTLFAHCVGAGKTFEMIATAMESKRLGLCTKSLFAVPNHLTEQIGDDFQKLYPGANILVATKKDFQKANRQQLFAKIATGNYDAVIIGHSQLGKIPISKERQVMTIQSQIDDILRGIEELKKSEGSKFQIKAMERTRKSLQKQLDKLEKANQDDTLTFEQLGIDRLFVDEAHEFKNLFVATKLQNVAGISNSASQKALDLFLKCRYLDEKTGGKGVVFATGTPLSNSITELHTMMRYLEYDFLNNHGLQRFDNWVAVFGDQKTDWELKPAGNGFKERTRIANYTGLPELMSMFKQVADIRTADTLQLDVPDCEYQVVQVEATPFQQELVQELADRADAINAGNVDPTIDNMLKITSDGRKLGLDPRLIDPSFEDNPETKLNRCVENVARIHAETAEDKLTQIIFCDLGVPHKAAGEAEVESENADDAKDKKSIADVESLEEECDFCVYDDIRDKLIAKGIPAEEIAYIHDAKTEQQKSDLFDKVRSGEIRVLLGSTAKMGTGTNVQKRLIAVHDLDIPWRPADLEQRAGRIIRQGNENKNVQIFRYVTKGTFDAYSYQTLENKQKFISQIMTSKTPARKCEDVDQQALTYSEIKALCTGDERIKEKLMLENEVKELRVLAAEHRNTVFEMEDRVARFPEQEQRLTTILNDLHTDREALRKLPIDPERKLPVFKITVGETEYSDRKEAAKALEDAVLAIKYADTPVKVGSFQGFDLTVTVNSNMMGGGMSACLKGATSHTTKLIESFTHNLNRLEAALYNIDSRIERTQTDLAKLRFDHEEAQKIVAESFPQQEELDSKEERLKVLTDELNQAAIEAKKNTPKREKTCYFERAKMKRDAARLAKKPRTAKDKAKSKDKKQGIE